MFTILTIVTNTFLNSSVIITAVIAVCLPLGKPNYRLLEGRWFSAITLVSPVSIIPPSLHINSFIRLLDATKPRYWKCL